MVVSNLTKWFRKNRNEAAPERPRRVRRYAGMRIFASIGLFSAGGFFIWDAVNGRFSGPSLGLLSGAALSALGLFCAWDLLRP
jgi:hypothetical protein